MRIGLTIALLLWVSHIFSQTKITVVDDLSSETIIGAFVYPENDENNYSITNEEGIAYLHFPDLPSKIVISHIGYQNDTLLVENNKDVFARLKELTMDEIVISANKSKANHHRGVSTTMDIEKIKLLPSATGETDIFKSISIMPGIQVGEEGSSSLFVRGGSYDQNLILLDEMPVYNTNHLYGYINAFNATAVKNFEVIKGGLSPQYGGRLSSVIKIDTKDGNKNKIETELGLGLVGSYFSSNGKINDNLTYLVDVRSSYLSLVASIVNRFSESKLNYWMYDNVVGLNYAKGSWTSSLRFYNSLDNDYNEVDFVDNIRNQGTEKGVDYLKTAWSNRVLSLNNSYIYKGYVFKHTSGISNFNYIRKNIVESITYTQNDTISNNSKYIADSEIINFKNTFSVKKYLKGVAATIGIETNNYRFKAEEREERLSKMALNSYDINPFAELDIKIINQLHAKLGVRNSFYKNASFSYRSLQPRGSLNLVLSDNNSILLSYQKLVQNVHNINVGNYGFPNDLWVGATNKLNPSSVHQFDIQYKIDFKGFYAELGFYYKSMDGLAKFRGESDTEFYYFPDLNQWEELMFSGGKGRAYGMEIYLEKQLERLSIIGAYTLGFSDRKFEELNSGKWFPFIYDRRHDFSLTTLWNLNKKWKLSSTFIFQTGKAITVPVSRAPKGYGRNMFSTVNNGRLPSYHRLDIGLTRSIITKKGRKSSLRFSLSNAYNRRNVVSIQEWNNEKTRVIKSLPIIPSFSWNYVFN